MDLIAKILMWLETHDHAQDPRGVGFLPAAVDIPGYTSEEVQYHIRLSIQAGFVSAHPQHARNMQELTWLGHDTLDAFKAAPVNP